MIPQILSRGLPITMESVVSLFSCFEPLSRDQIWKLILIAKPMTLAVDPDPTKFILEFLDVLLPDFENIINFSILWHCAACIQKCRCHTSTKKSSLDPNVRQLLTCVELAVCVQASRVSCH